MKSKTFILVFFLMLLVGLFFFSRKSISLYGESAKNALDQFDTLSRVVLMRYPCDHVECGVELIPSEINSLKSKLENKWHGSKFYDLTQQCEIKLIQNGKEYDFFWGTTETDFVVLQAFIRYSKTRVSNFVTHGNYVGRQIVFRKPDGFLRIGNLNEFRCTAY